MFKNTENLNFSHQHIFFRSNKKIFHDEKLHFRYSERKVGDENSRDRLSHGVNKCIEPIDSVE